MFNIHKLRVIQNFNAYNIICQREKINFFLIIDVVKLLQSTLNDGEEFFERRIEFKRVKNKKNLDNLIKGKGHYLIDFADDAFAIKPKTYFLLKEIYEIQSENDKKREEFLAKKG